MAKKENEEPFSFFLISEEILISPIDNRDKILLDLGKDQHVVTVRSQVYLADGRQFQFTESRHKLDKFHFVDYAKRNQK